MDLDPFDLLIVGGGIVGAGVARDAAMRGLRVLLVEQADFASGTSSRTSRLLHGGIRYLAQWRFRLVREASLEKKIVGRIAPHLAQPLPFVFPTRRGSPYPRWKMSAGVKLYDLLAGGNFARSRTLSVEQVRERLPGLNADGLTGGVRYYDGLTQDARLVLDTLRSAAAHGAELRNYTRFTEADRSGELWLCRLEERATDRQDEVAARAVVNAAGPWSDRIPHSHTRLRPTKGVHLVIDRARLPIADAAVMLEGARVLFAIPWGERVILGTTDTDYDGPLESPRCNEQDMQYILEVARQWFPAAALEPRDVISTWAGLRPLLSDPVGQPSDISRHHEITTVEPGWWDVTGGKLTTYRLMAQQTVDQIARYLNRPPTPCRTAIDPLLPGEDAPEVSGILPPPVRVATVRHYCREEWAVHLDDVMIRRAGWHYSLRDIEPAARDAAAWMANSLGWSDEVQSRELDRYLELVRESREVKP